VRPHYWYAPFLADTECLMQATAIDSPALQPRIVIKKANETEPKAGILQQFAQDKGWLETY